MNKYDKTNVRSSKENKNSNILLGRFLDKCRHDLFFRRLSLAAALQRNSNRLKKSTF